MQHITTTGILSLLETNKEQRKSFTEDLVTRLSNGEINPLHCHMQLKCMEEVVTNTIKDERYSKMLLDEAEKHGKSFEMYNAEFQIKETGTKYDYSICEDVVYNELMKQKEDIEAKIKARQKFLQNIPESGIADPDNGNMIYRAAKSSTTSVTTKLK
jgi:hypothetical protein